MGLRRVPYRGLQGLLARHLVIDEEPPTAELIRSLRHVKPSKQFSRSEFLAMCRWKSPRALHHHEANSSAVLRRVSRAVFRTRSERRRLELLTSLEGVSVPTASAILTLTDPRRYGVIDVRVWQLLFRLRSVDRNPRGVGFRFADWAHYLMKLRHHAKRLGVSVRRVEHSLFLYHQRTQTGRLYERTPRSRQRPSPRTS